MEIYSRKLPLLWDVDVIVVGAGSAGATAAIAAARNGAFERPNTFGAGTGITYDPFVLQLVWEELAQQAGVQLLYHTFCPM